jgi:hypothetical protein
VRRILIVVAIGALALLLWRLIDLLLLVFGAGPSSIVPPVRRWARRSRAKCLELRPPERLRQRQAARDRAQRRVVAGERRDIGG